MTLSEESRSRGGGEVAGRLPAGDDFEFDYFISRRGTSAPTAQEVADTLAAAGHSVRVQDYDFLSGANFIAEMHEAIKKCRHFIALLSADYETSEYTRQEWTAFMAARGRGGTERRFIPLRIEDFQPDGLLAAYQYTDLVGVDDPQERRRRILAAVAGAAVDPRAKIAVLVKTFHGVPPRNPHFTGRDVLLDRLHSTLMGNGASVPQVALHGMGGIGKTSIVAEYVHRHAGQYAGVWWAPAQERAVLTTSLAELGTELDPKLAGEKDVRLAAQGALHKVSRSATPWLLIYDNVESPDRIADLVPGRGARLIITTRWADWVGRAAEIEIDLLDPETAIAFLLTRSGRKDAEGATRLATALGNLPLALDHAGAYVRLTGMSFDRYCERLEELIAKAPRGAAYPESVGATFGLAIEQACKLCAATEPLLAFFAVLGADRIPLDLADDSILPEDDRAEALMALTEVSLIDHEAEADGTPSISLHRLVRAAMRARLNAANKIEAAVSGAVRQLAGAFPDEGYGNPDCWARCAQLLPHVLELREEARRIGMDSEELARLLDAAANFLNGRSVYAAAEPLYREALAMGEKLLGRDHPDVGQWLNNFANLLLNTGRNSEAEPLYRRAIEIGTKSLGRDHVRVATRLNNLAVVLMDTGQYPEAEALLREAIDTVEKKCGRESDMFARRLYKFANLLASTGRLEEAEKAFRESIRIGELKLGPDHSLVADWKSGLAKVLRDCGRCAEAEPLFREALATWMKTGNDAHTSFGFLRHEYAKLLALCGRAEEACTQAMHALEIHVRAFGSTHQWTQNVATVLADSLEALGRREEARNVRRCHGLCSPE
jgi:tetratricopeptide (TPR) repeat protein